MNRLSAFLVLLLVTGAITAPAQSTEDQYVRIYNLIQQADTLNNGGQSARALPKYLEAQTALQSIKKQNPSWNPKVVNFRIEYVADKIAGLSATNAPAPGTKTAPLPVITPPVPPPSSTGPRPVTPTETPPPLTTLQDEVTRLQSEKNILEAKLKEALATQPAAVDPRELAKAQEKIQFLLKENDLLKNSLAEEKEQPKSGAEAKEIEFLKTALADANRKLTEQLSRANSLLAEQQNMQKRLDALAANTNDVAGLKESLAEANRKLQEQSAATGKLTAERNSLREQVGLLTASVATTDALRAENQLLKQQLTQAKSATGSNAGDENRRRVAAEAQLAILQSDAQVLRLEKVALENRLQKAATTKTATASPTVSNEVAAQRIKQLEQERDELHGRSGKELIAQVDQLSKEVTGLRARVEVFEARAIPYSAEELALFQPVQPGVVAIVDPAAGRKSIRELPVGSAALVAAAQRNFAAKEFDKAEANYLEILRQDETNPSALANLAAIQLEMGRLDEAEKNIKQALSTAPNDGYDLSILGYVKYRQEKYDEALDALSRAAKVIPQSAEIQNYLGVTLSQKGLRGPAETALRKAIQIDPKYSDAHNNLAVIYATQTPPLIELARWHYQKALAAGHPKNPDLEKLLDKKEAPPK